MSMKAYFNGNKSSDMGAAYEGSLLEPMCDTLDLSDDMGLQLRDSWRNQHADYS